jgi:AraC-like DNA-binding protein
VPASSVRQFTDPDDYSSSFRDFQYELNVTVGGGFAAEHIRVDLNALRLQHYSSNLPWVAHTAIPDGRAVFALRAEPGPSLQRAGKEIVTTSIERLARGQTIYTCSSGAVSWGTISLSVDALAAIGVATSGCEFTPPIDVTTETPEPGMMERLRRLYASAGRLARTAPEILAHPEAARSLEHDLVPALAACLGPKMNEEDAVAKRRHAAIMRRFRGLVAASGDRPVYTTDLCAAIGVSDRTLEVCCREHLGMGPQKYLRLRRIQRVRRALALADPTSASVTGIATAHGFWELGRFAGVYRSVYGESPSQTLAADPAKFSESA